MSSDGKTTGFIILIICCLVALMFACSAFFGRAYGRDLGQWGDGDSEVKQWYRSLKMPDYPNASCCGEADSYWCNEKSRGDQVVCVIDDDRDNIVLKRTPVPNGTVIEIPQHKINKDPNLAGHAVVFLSSGGLVYCFVGISGS